MTTRHLARLVLLAVGCSGVGIWASRASLGQQDAELIDRNFINGALIDDITPELKTTAEKGQPQLGRDQVGRYRVSVIQSQREIVLLDTATGQLWLRNVNGRWFDVSNPDLKKEKVGVRTPIAPPVDGDERPSPPVVESAKAASVLVDRESEALLREVTEALKAAQTPAAKRRLGNDLRKAIDEAKKWNELESLPPQVPKSKPIPLR